MAKQSYRNDIIRGLSLVLALTVFFVGPRFIESEDTRDIDSAVRLVKASNISKQIAAPIIAQLESDKRYIQQNSNIIDFGVKMSAVNWLAFIIIAVGFAGPFLLKWRQNSTAKKEGV